MFYILKGMEYKSTLEISKELGRKYDSVLAPMNIRYTRGNRGENVKEHKFVNHSGEYAKDNVHVNIRYSLPDDFREISE